MFCPKCGKEGTLQTNFCKFCGLKLSKHAQLLEEQPKADKESEERLHREEQFGIGIYRMTVIIATLMLFFGSLATILCINVGKEHQGAALFLASFLIILYLAVFRELYLIWYPGIYNDIKMLILRRQFADLKHKDKELIISNSESAIEMEVSKHPPSQTSITENTTRELQKYPSPLRKD